MCPVQRAGLRHLFVQCRNKFGGSSYTSLQTNNADAPLSVNKFVKKRNTTNLFGTLGTVGLQNAPEIAIGTNRPCL
jgi:hypothetical protein